MTEICALCKGTKKVLGIGGMSTSCPECVKFVHGSPSVDKKISYDINDQSKEIESLKNDCSILTAEIERLRKLLSSNKIVSHDEYVNNISVKIDEVPKKRGRPRR